MYSIKKMKKYKKIILSGLFLSIILPIISFAQTPPVAKLTCSTNVSNIGDIICRIGAILNSIIPVLVVLGVVYFVWGVISYMIGADEEQKKKGRDKIIYGIIGLVVIVGMWGLVNVVTSTFGLNNSNTNIQTPCVPGTVC